MVDHIFVLVKNEGFNIQRCLEATTRLGIPITVLDSGSTDSTIQRVKSFESVQIERFSYQGHCDAYNDLTVGASADQTLLILDADMQVDAEYVLQVDEAFERLREVDVVVAPVSMYWEGLPLRHGSLYPPKAIAFRGGKAYFEPVGHGERLIAGCRPALIKAPIVHDDRRSFSDEIHKQVQYGERFAFRSASGQVTWKDRIRYRTPLFILLSPIVSYLFRFGFLSGRLGRIYALDRLIAEALMHRTAVAARLRNDINADPARLH